jgi:hypothetical protein
VAAAAAASAPPPADALPVLHPPTSIYGLGPPGIVFAPQHTEEISRMFRDGVAPSEYGWVPAPKPTSSPPFVNVEAGGTSVSGTRLQSREHESTSSGPLVTSVSGSASGGGKGKARAPSLPVWATQEDEDVDEYSDDPLNIVDGIDELAGFSPTSAASEFVSNGLLG